MRIDRPLRSKTRVFLWMMIPLLLILSGCASDKRAGSTPPDSDLPAGEVSYRVQAAGLTAQNQRVLIHKVTAGEVAAEPLKTATVTVNGEELSRPTAGFFYEGSLGTALAAGALLELKVQVDDVEITGAAAVPSIPLITGPANGTNFAPEDSVTVEWTSTLDPDRFDITLQWAGGSRVIPVADGTARSAEVPAAQLPSDGTPVTIQVTAFTTSEFTGPAHADSQMSISQQGAVALRPAITVGATPPVVTYYVEGLNVGTTARPSLFVHRAYNGVVDLNEPATDATVTLNGEPLVFTPSAYRSFYSGDLPTAPAVGDTLTLRVLIDGQEVTGSGVIPEPMPVTAPADGAHFLHGDPITLEWSGSIDPDEYAFGVFWDGGNTWFYEKDGSARHAEMPLAQLPTDTPIRVQTVALEHGSFTGPAAPESKMKIESRSDFATAPKFTIGGP